MGIQLATHAHGVMSSTLQPVGMQGDAACSTMWPGLACRWASSWPGRSLQVQHLMLQLRPWDDGGALETSRWPLPGSSAAPTQRQSQGCHSAAVSPATAPERSRTPSRTADV